MSDVQAKYVPASISHTAFNCPHCGALTTQHWFRGYAQSRDKNELPMRVTEETYDRLRELGAEAQAKHRPILDKIASGVPFIERQEQDVWSKLLVRNLHISRCYNCDDISVWVYDRLLWPKVGSAPPANPDLPAHIRADYEEASTILDLSTRGAAALLRLAIQKLCKHLGQPGKNINDDIGALVKAGLDPRVQKSLDFVRVVGNNAVHPGELNVGDDRDVAEKLFRLVNLIAEKMISEPKHVDELYEDLPENYRKAIEKRDAP